MSKIKIIMIHTFVGCLSVSGFASGATRRVPGTYATIREAVNAAEDGDTILISDGTYKEGSIKVDKSLVVASKFLTDGNRDHIVKTQIDSGSRENTFETVEGTGLVEFVGLSFTGKEKFIVGNSQLDVRDCRFSGGADQVSFETQSFGRVTRSVFENSRDDAVDSDSAAKVADAFIEISNNTIANCGDDGIEIRLYRRSSGPIMPYTIENNIITHSDEDGIQLIDARSTRNDNSRVFYIANNLIKNSGDAGIGCMPEQDTIENFGGAPDMDEPVFVTNNTIVENRYGISGGANMVVLNTIIKDNSVRGIAHVGGRGIVDYSLFHNNGEHLFRSTEGGRNFKNRDPGYAASSYQLLSGSFSIDRGIALYRHRDVDVLDLPDGAFRGPAPDLGAFEAEFGSAPDEPDVPVEPSNSPPEVSAGLDKVLRVPATSVDLHGRVNDDGLPQNRLNKSWSMVSGPASVLFSSPSEEDTTVTFSRMGVYELRLSAHDGSLEAHDHVTVHYVSDGSGDVHTLDGDLFVNAEDYSYLYGTATVVSDVQAEGNLAVMSLDKRGTHAFADYLVKTVNRDVSLSVWVRMKGRDTSSNSLTVTFDGSTRTRDDETVEGDDKYRWERIDGKFQTEAGVWRLRIKAREDGVVWDTIALSTRSAFNPVVPQPQPVRPGPTPDLEAPAAHWTMEDIDGFSGTDISGNQHDLTIEGARSSTGRIGERSLRFDGHNDTARANHSESLGLKSALTLSLWFKPDDLAGGQSWPHLISKRGAYRLYVHTNKRMTFNIFVRGAGFTLRTPQALPNSGWTHAVATYDGQTMRLYVNGEFVGKRAQPGPIDANKNPVHLGSRRGQAYFFDGRLDDVRVYDRALNDSEVRQVFQSGSP